MNTVGTGSRAREMSTDVSRSCEMSTSSILMSLLQATNQSGISIYTTARFQPLTHIQRMLLSFELPASARIFGDFQNNDCFDDDHSEYVMNWWGLDDHTYQAIQWFFTSPQSSRGILYQVTLYLRLVKPYHLCLGSQHEHIFGSLSLPHTDHRCTPWKKDILSGITSVGGGSRRGGGSNTEETVLRRQWVPGQR